jgi:hypothetical protein
VWPDIRIDPKGIRVSGAQIIGILDLEAVTIAVPLRLRSCHIVQQPLLEGAKIKLLDLGASHLASGLAADGIHVTDDVVLNERFSATGTVRLAACRT